MSPDHEGLLAAIGKDRLRCLELALRRNDMSTARDFPMHALGMAEAAWFLQRAVTIPTTWLATIASTSPLSFQSVSACSEGKEVQHPGAPSQISIPEMARLAINTS